MRIILTAFFVLIAGPSLAQDTLSTDYPFLYHVSCACRVTFDNVSSMYYYSYTLHNDAGNKGDIWALDIDISRNGQSASYDTVGLRFATYSGTDLFERWFRRRYPSRASSILPVGFPNVPQNWTAILRNQSVSFSADTLYPKPGEEVSGFVLMSKAPPGIRAFRAEPFFNIYAFFPDADDTTKTMTKSQMDSIRAATAFTGISIGATAPSASFQPLVFLDTLSSITSQSRYHNWITQQSTADKYAGLFARAKGDVIGFNLTLARARLDTVLQQVVIDSSSTLTSEAYALILYNTIYLKNRLNQASLVKSGVLNQSGSMISVRAKPSTSFGSGDTLKCIEVTLRWLTSYGITLGTVSSPVYGFSKDGSVTTVGSYSYQKFRTTTSQLLNWSANTEYELFTVPVNGYSGLENFELTNSLSGGEWFVDVNYLDKTDSTFYQGTATGFINLNKSLSNTATQNTVARHVMKAGGKLHEVFVSNSQIFYRRQDLSTLAWDVTKKITTTNGVIPCVAAASNNSVHLVWQAQGEANYDLYYARSTDNGATWSTPITLPGCTSLAISSYQTGLDPVVAEAKGSGQILAPVPNHLLVVFVYSTGLFYTRSTDNGATWLSPPVGIVTGSTGPRISKPSLAPASNFAILTYQYYARNPAIYSRKYTTTSGWTSEATVDASSGTISDAYNSVAVDNSNNPIAAWCGQKTGQSEYRILFRQGTSSNTWGSWFVEFAHSTGISDYYPSISYLYRYSQAYGIDIVYHRSNGEVRVNKCMGTSWWNVLLGTSGQWAGSTIEGSGSPAPTWIWTDQSASPYQLNLLSDSTSIGPPPPPPGAPQGAPELHREVVLQNSTDNSILTFEINSIKVVTTTNQTVVIPFRSHDVSQTVSATLENVWDYLGTNSFTVPANCRTLIVDAKIDATGSAFTSKSFRVDLVQGTQATTLLTDQTGSSGLKQMDVSGYAGQQITIRPVGIIPPSQSSNVTVGIGDVYVSK